MRGGSTPQDMHLCGRPEPDRSECMQHGDAMTVLAKALAVIGNAQVA
jgi:hypothetical protein